MCEIWFISKFKLNLLKLKKMNIYSLSNLFKPAMKLFTHDGCVEVSLWHANAVNKAMYPHCDVDPVTGIGKPNCVITTGLIVDFIMTFECNCGEKCPTHRFREAMQDMLSRNIGRMLVITEGGVSPADNKFVYKMIEYLECGFSVEDAKYVVEQTY